MSPAAPGPRLRTALVGLGRIGFGFHGPAIRGHAGFEFVGVVDPLAERRAEAAAEWSVPAFATLEDLVAAVRPDLVVIASPTRFHAGQACAAFAAGAHVFCDKPVAREVAEFDAMVAAARAAGRRLLAYQPYRLRPEVRSLVALLRRGLLGPVHLIRRTRCDYVRRNDWQALCEQGGGLLNNYATHHLDELLAVVEAEEIRTVFCRTRRVASLGDAEDVVRALLVTAAGRWLDLEISQASALPVAPWQVFGAHGAATWDAAAQAWRVRWFDPAEAPARTVQAGLAAAGRRYADEELPWREETLPAATLAAPLDYYDAAWRHFAQGAPPPVTLEESRRLLELVARCRAGAESGGVV